MKSVYFCARFMDAKLCTETRYIHFIVCKMVCIHFYLLSLYCIQQNLLHFGWFYFPLSVRIGPHNVIAEFVIKWFYDPFGQFFILRKILFILSVSSKYIYISKKKYIGVVTIATFPAIHNSPSIWLKCFYRWRQPFAYMNSIRLDAISTKQY